MKQKPRGKRMNVRFLTTSQAIAFHEAVINEDGGSHGVRDPGLLDSAVHAAQATWGGAFLYPSIFDMAAAYAWFIALNHPFVDGNKRTAWITARTFLRLNGYRCKIRKSLVTELMVDIAAGKTRDWKHVAAFFAEHSSHVPT